VARWLPKQSQHKAVSSEKLMAKIRQTSISVSLSPDFHRVIISQSQTRQHVRRVLVLMVEWSDSNSDAYCLLWSQVVQKSRQSRQSMQKWTEQKTCVKG